MTQISIAILSDLHCHGLGDAEGKRESFLVVGDPRVPANRHPIQSLIELIQASDIRADVLVCCGDMSNKISQQGLSQAWDFIRNDLKTNLGSNTICCAIGNHDVDPRSTSSHPFKTAQTIHPEFPFKKEEDKNQLWAQGFCIQVIDGLADFLVINTAYHHYSESAAQIGTLETTTIQAIDNYLAKKCRQPLRIAVLHHHPILHSFLDRTTADVLPTGDQLLDVLSKHRFNFVVHGHRHQPRIRRHTLNNHQFHIMCAGAFSAYLSELSSRTRNVFHLLELHTPNDTCNGVSGVVKTWEYGLGKGWSPATIQSAEFPHIVAIGPAPSIDLAPRIIQYFKQQNLTYVPRDELEKAFSDIKYLLPDELDGLKQSLLSNDGLKAEIEETGPLIGIGKTHRPTKLRNSIRYGRNYF